MAERIYDILARQKATAIETGNCKAAKGLTDLQRRIARGVTRGWFIQDVAVSVETPDNIRRLSPEQLQGLESIGFTFTMDVQALSLDQLSKDSSVRHLFDSVTHIAELRNIVPVARQVAVNPGQPYVKGSENLGYDDQLEVRDRVVKDLLKAPLKRGTLEGIGFAPDRASVLSQLDFAYQVRLNGRKLYPNYFVRSQDEYDHPEFGPFVMDVGRFVQADQLYVDRWYRLDCRPDRRLSLVATPAGSR